MSRCIVFTRTHFRICGALGMGFTSPWMTTTHQAIPRYVRRSAVFVNMITEPLKPECVLIDRCLRVSLTRTRCCPTQVNHLMIVNRAGWQQSYATNSDNDQDQITGTGASVLVYVLFADPPYNNRQPASVFTQLMNAIVSGCYEGVSSSPSTLSQVSAAAPPPSPHTNTRTHTHTHTHTHAHTHTIHTYISFAH
jgi:hypothetical protein